MFYNPYMQMNKGQNMEQFNPYSQNYQPTYQQSYPQNPQNYPQQGIVGLQGKIVDSIDVVKAIDIPLDGSTSYFALADGSAIVTKQLQRDGTSKTIVYKPISQEEVNKKVDYITSAEFEKRFAEETQSYAEIRDEIKNVKKQMRDISEEMRKLKGRDDEDESY